MTESESTEDVVRGVLAEAWELFTSDFVLWIVADLIVLVGSLVSLGILSGPLTVGFIQLVEKRRRGEDCSPTDVFEGFSHFGTSFIAFLLIVIGIFVGSMFMLLPGLLFAFVVAFTFHAIALDDETAIGAMQKSFGLIKDSLIVSVVFLVIVLVLSGIGGAVVFGTLLTAPFTVLLMNLAYHRLSALSDELASA